MKKRLRKLLVGSLLLLSSLVPAHAQSADQATLDEAKAIIDRFTGGTLKVNLELSLSKDSKGCDSYATSMKDGVLTIKGSNGVALCRGAYAFIKEHQGGMRTWQGQRFDASKMPSTASETKVTSPFRDHYYLNVVTYGYTMPYWNQERWDEEIDWMALHGIDMPLSLVAQEAVYRIVFKQLGLTDAQIDKWEVGPAHLPWMRMGNLSGNSFDGPLTRNWDNDQIELQKHILKRMRALGMKPIFPAFGGFVPPAYKVRYPNDVTMTGWGWVPNNYRNYRLAPNNEKFVEIGTKFVQTWDSIFGKGELYLSDSFNEMAIPSDKALLTQYGDSIYKSLRAANPDAKWVMQGWTVGYQRNDWKDGKLQSLIQNVPDDKFMLLDMASDYNKFIWGSSYDWDFYPKFYGKEWVWSVIPNMGGKTAFTGRLDYYANGRRDALNSANRGNLTGYGFAPEGEENNEMVYELLCDGGWTADEINLDNWMTSYATNRYGSKPAYITTLYNGLRKSVYNSFTDHPRFGWQVSTNIWGSGSINQNSEFDKAVESVFDQVQTYPDEQLLKNDLIEAAAFYAGGKAQAVLGKIKSLTEAGQKEEAKAYIPVVKQLMLDMDRALSCHTLYRLDKWEDQAQACGHDATEKAKYARNARRIVSVWYGNHTSNEPVVDYAARIWSGMIRDYYWPRVEAVLDTKINGTSSKQLLIENNFVRSAPALSDYEPVPADTLAFLKELVDLGKNAASSNVKRETVINPSNDFTNTWYDIRGGYDPLNDYAITQHGEGQRLTVSTYTAQGEQMWRFIPTGETDVYYVENRYGYNISGTGQQSNGPVGTLNQGASTVKMRLRLKDDGSKRWLIIPANQDVQGLHAASAGNITTWTTVDADGSTWILQEVPEAQVPEAVSSDYERYLKKLNDLKSKPMGSQVGQPKSRAMLEAAIDSLNQWKADINHQSYNAFLAKWAALYKNLIISEEDIASGIVQLEAQPLDLRVQDSTILVNHSKKGIKVYNLQGQRVNNEALQPGHYAVHYGGRTYKVMVTSKR